MWQAGTCLALRGGSEVRLAARHRPAAGRVFGQIAHFRTASGGSGHVAAAKAAAFSSAVPLRGGVGPGREAQKGGGKKEIERDPQRDAAEAGE